MIDTKAEGRRHLWCLHCGTAWRHPRLQCAFCGCSDQSRLRHIHLEGEENWRLQGCRDCKRYVKEFRSEEELGSLPWDALLLGSTELDLAAVQHDLMRESPLVSQRPHRPSPLAAAQIEDHHMSPNPERGR
jgi:formate dehydrogenase maturation protein FdhE